jgi:hypothetical protein
MVWETDPRNYFFIFSSPLEFRVFFLHSIIAQTVFMHLSKKEIKFETNVIAIITQLSSVALK